MKKLILSILIAILFLSCNKKDGDYKYLSYIIAGQIEGIGVKYVDIEPDDSIFCNCQCIYDSCLSDSIGLDFNNDKLVDFQVITKTSPWTLSSAYYYSIEIKPLGNNSVCVSKTNNSWVDSLNLGDTIDSRINWSDSIAMLYSYYHQYFTPTGPITTIKGYWDQNKGYYIGIRIVNGDNQFFGWIDIRKWLIQQYAITIPYLI